MEKAVSVLTFKSIETILRDGGTQSWALAADRARACKYVVICRNAKTREAQGPEAHGSAFMVGKISDVVPSTKTVGRWLIKMSEYALVDWPEQWEGRNPVAYGNTDDYDVIEDFGGLDFHPMPSLQTARVPERLTLSLPPALEAWIEARVSSGQFVDAADYLRDLVRRDQLQAERVSVESVDEMAE